MKMLGIPDIHGDLEKLKKIHGKIKTVDIVFLIGDISNFGYVNDMKDILEPVKEINPQCYVVPGNCDFPETEEIMDSLEMNLNGRHIVFEEVGFVGLGASLETPFKGTPFEVSEDHLESRLKAAVENYPENTPMILISHQPPYGTKADTLPNGMQVGSKSVRSFIEKYQPIACFTGHIHEGRGIDSIGKTKVINPGPLFQGYYAYAEIEGEEVQMEMMSL